MRFAQHLLASFAVVLVFCLPLSAGAAAGRTPGAATVTSSGSSSYSIPIAVPPGVNGMTPSLGLSYSSRTDNGVMGVGWSIDGMSAIVRCPRFLSADPLVQDPTFTQSFNRYSYAWNNPLTYSDPSGYSNSYGLRFYCEYACVAGGHGGYGLGADSTSPTFSVSYGPMFWGYNGSHRNVDDGPIVGGGAGQGGMTHVTPAFTPSTVNGHTADTVSVYRPLFRDNFAGRTLQDLDYGLGWLTQVFWDGPVRGLFSNEVPGGQELMDAKMGMVMAWMPVSRARAAGWWEWHDVGISRVNLFAQNTDPMLFEKVVKRVMNKAPDTIDQPAVQSPLLQSRGSTPNFWRNARVNEDGSE